MGMSDTSSQVVAIFAHVHCEAGEELCNVVRRQLMTFSDIFSRWYFGWCNSMVRTFLSSKLGT